MAMFLRLARQGSLPAMATFLCQHQFSACEAPQFERSKNHQFKRPKQQPLTLSEAFNLQGWLERNKMSAKAYDADQLLKTFLEEMEKGLTGKSSLKMIPSHVSVQETIGVLKNRNVAVVDAGGTNLRTALAKLDSEDGCMLPEQWVEEDMPGKHAEATREQFYNTLVARLKPMANEFKVIGFCFSFPTDITKDQGGNIDGRLIKFTKDINITGMEGSKVGAELLKALEKAEIKDKKVVVLNDTVASLLAGVDKIKDAYAYVGFILGTGTNTAYVEKNGNIAKIEKNIGSQVINVESGGFTEFERSVFDKKLDKDGVNIFEKAISGDYLGPLALLVMKGLASEEKVFTKAGAQKLLSMDNLKTKPISYIMCKGKTRKEDIEELTSFSDEDRKVIEELTSESFSDEDRKVMKQVFEAVVDRAALLAAVNIAAAVLKSGASKEDTRPVCITIDGTAYYKTHRLKEKTEHYLHGLLGEKHKIKYECIQIDRAPIIGAAIAGLTTYCQ